MLTGKQKRHLRALGNSLDPVLQVGKGGITPAVVKQTEETLEAQELIKCRVLQNCALEPKTAAEDLAGQAQADLVQVIGRNFLLYRPSKDKPLIVLP